MNNQQIIKHGTHSVLNQTEKEEYYHALIQKNPSYEGIFYAAIKTTGIFCRPTCTAKKPKKENVFYFHSVKDALDAGYRPCKVCRPLEKEGIPDWICTLLKQIDQEPLKKWKDYEIQSSGIDPVRLRRWFKKNYNITFHAYLRSLRINASFSQIKHGEKIIDAAFGTGYDSLSGYASAVKKITGESPSKSMKKNIIQITRMDTPLGPIMAGALEEGICLLEFTDRRMLENEFGILEKKFSAKCLPGKSKFFPRLEKELDEYFAGKRKKFTLPLAYRGSDFQMKAWKTLLEIPYGETRTYREEAEMMGHPAAVRAAGTANGMNMISILIPCHRVIASGGKLGGYGGGLRRKQYLLDLEKENSC
ncbi:MAG: methylated-DNA--[protein]-cysteine S-methyltransferase [Spirochaetia bacterium]|nr:methylated-DNA--[protein]-cysteine S-methyltransferase [Spirochaetia bacterium]